MKNNSRKGILDKKSIAQGTIEYLVIVAVIVVISLVVVALVANQSDSFQGVSSTANKIGSSSGTISISEAVVDSDGNGLFGLSNNSEGLLIITGLSVGNSDLNYGEVYLSQGDTKVFSLSELGSNCSCAGFEGETRTCDVVIHALSEYGLEKEFTTTVSVECVSNVTPVNLSTIVQPIQNSVYSVVLNVNDFFSGSFLPGFSMDCNTDDYDSTMDSPAIVDFGFGSYSCTFSKEGYNSSTKTIIVDGNKSVNVYLDSLSANSIHLSDCSTLNIVDGNYILDSDIGSGGACLIIDANNARINGNDYTITGNVSGGASIGYCGMSDPYCNQGEYYCETDCGSVWVDANYRDFSLVDSTIVGEVSSTGGANITIINSTVSSVNSVGGTGISSDWDGGIGGSSGTITLINSIASSIISTGGAGGISNYGDIGGAGGSTGTITLTDSNVLGVISLTGGTGSSGYMVSGNGGSSGTINLDNVWGVTKILAIGGNSSATAGTGGNIIFALPCATQKPFVNVGGGIASAHCALNDPWCNESEDTCVNMCGSTWVLSSTGSSGTITPSNNTCNAKAINAFSFSGLGTGVIDEDANTISVTVPYGTIVTALTPDINFTGASVSPSGAQNFTTPVTYTVTDIDGSTKDYEVTVNVLLNSDKAITAFNFTDPEVTGIIDEEAHTVSLTVPYQTNVTALVPTITVSEEATISPASLVAVDFTNPVTYTVTAQNDSTQDYIVTVYILAPPAITLSLPSGTPDYNSIKTFSYSVSSIPDISSCELIFDGVVDQTDIEAPFNSFTKQLADGNYTWDVNCTNEIGEASSINGPEDFNYTFTIALTWQMWESSYTCLNGGITINGVSYNPYNDDNTATKFCQLVPYSTFNMNFTSGVIAQADSWVYGGGWSNNLRWAGTYWVPTPTQYYTRRIRCS